MGKAPCCYKEGLNKGAWTELEDKLLTTYVKAHGEGKWKNLPKRAGLKRCGKSCRLRWLNYLRPDIKRGNISNDEEELIIRLHNLLGNRWSLIAGRLPGRTDNEIKNYWNTTLGKKAKAKASSPTSMETPSSKSRLKKLANGSQVTEPLNSPQAIRTKAIRCSSSKVLLPLQPSPTQDIDVNNNKSTLQDPSKLHDYRSYSTNHQDLDDTARVQSHPGTNVLDQGFLNFGINDQQLQASNGDQSEENNDDIRKNLFEDPVETLPFDEVMLKDWTTNLCLNDNVAMDLDSLAYFLDPDEWF